MQQVKIPQAELVPVADLKIDGQNPNRMSEQQLQALVENIRKYGFIVPIITNSELVIADGEQRLQAAKSMGMEKVMVIRLPLKEVDRKLLRQVLNKLKGRHNQELDVAEYERMLELDPEALQELSKLTAIDVSRFQQEIEFVKEVEEDDFDVEKAKQEPKYEVSPGEIWKLGDHKLICGDSTQESVMDALMAGKSARLCFTSPPYNMAGDLYQEFKDNKESEEYVNFNITVAGNVKRYLKGFIFWNISYNKKSRWEFIEIFYRLIKDCGYTFLENIVWDKGSALPISSPKILTRQYENILVASTEEIEVVKELEYNFLGTTETDFLFNKRTQRGLSNYWKITPRNTQLDMLKACFPVNLPARGIKLMTNKGDLVVDPFGGSGSTLIAAEQLGRRCNMIELSPVYCSVIIERWEEFTKQKAIKQ